MAFTIAFDKVWNKVRNLPRLTTDNVETIRFSLKEIFDGEEHLLHKPIDWYVDNGIDLRTIFEVTSLGEFVEMQDRYWSMMSAFLRDTYDLDYGYVPDPDMCAKVSSESIRDWMRNDYDTVFINWFSHSEEEILAYLRDQDWALIGCNTADLYNLKTFHIENRTGWTCRRSKYHVKSFIGRDGFSNIYEVPIGETALQKDLGISLEELIHTIQFTFPYDGPLHIEEYIYNHIGRPLCKLSAVEVVRFGVRMTILRVEIYHAFSKLGRMAMDEMFLLDQTILDYLTSGTVGSIGQTCAFRDNYFVVPEMWAPVEP